MIHDTVQVRPKHGKMSSDDYRISKQNFQTSKNNALPVVRNVVQTERTGVGDLLVVDRWGVAKTLSVHYERQRFQ